MSKSKGFPKNPVQALRAQELLTALQQLTAANDWKRAAPLSLELTRIAPELTEAHDIMGRVAFQTTAFDIAETCFERAVALGPVNAMRLHAWATALIARGNFKAAEKALERALVFRPKDAQISCDLADAYLAQDRSSDAFKLFRSVAKQNPANSYARHMLSALSDARQPDRTYVTNLFDSYAPMFDQHLTGALHYRIPEIVAEAVTPYSPFASVLDLGCGTGLIAEALKGKYAAIDGVDLSPRMIEKATERGLYRTLTTGDCVDALKASAELASSYDLIAALDLLIYIGPAEDLFQAVAAKLSPKGLFVFTTEAADDTGIIIRSSGRFAHSSQYIRSCLAANGLAVLDQQHHTIRLEHEKPIPGEVYICRRN
ncbi:methyltransferase domain-containing protein [Devosia sp. MC1541]|uniref:methyltransferase domain-containing protein n=1 Tax=Devosia sp. MC1541 TaxID=2725264 RepID=UPI00145E215D|nr:methyltransferase domain-containing protein [Devosia sp. MC1541]